MIRKAAARDLDAVELLYSRIHDAEEAGIITTGWLRTIYPTRATAEAALARDDLFVLEDGTHIIGSAIINRIQVDVYEGAPWENAVPDDQVCVLHTLVISPSVHGKGYGHQFVEFYEAYAESLGCTELRIDTNERNLAARMMYAGHGYREIATVPTVFNGIAGVNLVLMEKPMKDHKTQKLRFSSSPD